MWNWLWDAWQVQRSPGGGWGSLKRLSAATAEGLRGAKTPPAPPASDKTRGERRAAGNRLQQTEAPARRGSHSCSPEGKMILKIRNGHGRKDRL